MEAITMIIFNLLLSAGVVVPMNQDNEGRELYVLHPNGDSQRASLTKSLFQNAPSDKMILYPGSMYKFSISVNTLPEE